jgi:multisubunit Na+/H+ antiporter MnhF subunit
LVIYWLIAGKLDFFNHQLSGSIMLLVALYNLNKFDINILNIIFVIFIFFLFKLAKNYLSAFNWKINYHIDKKIHHFIIAIILGLWFSNWLITISILFTMLGIIGTIQILKYQNNYHNCSF